MAVLKITAAKNSGDETTLELVDTDGTPVDLTSLAATKVTVNVCGGGCNEANIDSDSDDVNFAGSTVGIKFGKLDLPATRNINTPYLPKISYVTAADNDAKVLAGQGYETEIQLRVVC